MLAVKPNLFPVVVRELKQCQGPANQLILSVMSGITIAEIEKVCMGISQISVHKSLRFPLFSIQGLFQKVTNLKAIIRVMPNTPALVNAGCAGKFISLIDENYQS